MIGNIWQARRRGCAVVIRGFVKSPRMARAIFDRLPEPRTDTRTWRFYFEPPSTDPRTECMLWVEHVEPDVPRHVRKLQIVMPSGETVVIRSQQPV